VIPGAAARRRRLIELAVGIGVVAACCAFVFLELQPSLLFRDTTANGGDTGAHVWWPAFFGDNILGTLRLSGWSQDYYAGFPVGHFYFPLPAFLVWLGDLVLPYNVSFKLVTAAGPVLLPAGAYVFARGIRVRWPAPPLFAAASVLFLFDLKYQNWGGNLTSTLQGEFSFSLGLALGLFFLGVFARALRTGRGRALAAVLFAATIMCHIIVAGFVVGAAVMVWLGFHPARNLVRAATIGVIGLALTAVWALPLVARLGYTTDMGWQKLTNYVDVLFPTEILWVVGLAVVGAVSGVVGRRRPAIVVCALTVAFGLLVRLMPEGRVWNGRLVPFYYLMLFLLAALGAADGARWVGRLSVWAWARAERPLGVDDASDADAVPAGSDTGGEDAGWERSESTWSEPTWSATTDGTVAAPVREPGEGTHPAFLVATVVAVAASLAALAFSHADRSFLDDWARWNNTGFEGRDAAPEFFEIMDTMGALPEGRAVWERADGLNNYGTDLALELLPYFTDGRIASMEGLYFESSATTPFHFLMTAKLASEPSNPVRFPDDSEVVYGPNAGNGSPETFDHGIRQLQALGVRYLMLTSDEAIERADAHESLSLVAEVDDRDGVEPDGWRIYQVADASLVSGLAYEPVVLEGVGPGDWLEPAALWWEDPTALERLLASGGPPGWVRAAPDEAVTEAFRALPPVEVSDIEESDDSVSFSVDETGVPVVVRTSYFPGWSASGADGPWRLTPNLMVVVPTEHDVTLSYGPTGLDRIALGISLLGLGGLVALTTVERRRRRGPVEQTGTAATTPPAASHGDVGEDGGAGQEQVTPVHP